MKKIALLFVFLATVSCSSTRMINNWKNTEYQNYAPKKVLVVGVTPNVTARKIFEEKLENELNARGIDAVESYDICDDLFTSPKETEEEIQSQLNRFVDMGYDAILVTVVRGVEEETSLSEGVIRTDHFWRRFGGYYFVSQDIFFNPRYYERYKIYLLESSLYDITKTDEKSLVWVASFELIDPKDITRSSESYVKQMIKSLEKEGIIPEL